jgi:hypothetical protein
MWFMILHQPKLVRAAERLDLMLAPHRFALAGARLHIPQRDGSRLRV